MTAKGRALEHSRLELERDGAVARVWLNRPALRNALDGESVSELRRVFGELSADDAVRVIVLGGRGAAFCAGADLDEMRAMADASREQNLGAARALAELFAAVHDAPQPVLARVHGAALGGGAGLVAACDIAIATETAKFGFTEVRLGIVPAVISPYVLPRIGESAARELFLTGERIDGRAAQAIGLVRAAVPEDQLDAAVDERVRLLLLGGPRALSAAKRLIEQVASHSGEAVRSYCVERIAELRVSPEGQEGLRAFLEKRKPEWAP